ncbi:MAG: amidohydrolase [Bacteroidales bacterium]
MKLALIQNDIVWEDKQENLRKTGEIIGTIRPGTDIIILPEMFNTGFSMNPARLSEPPFSLTHTWMKNTAAKTGSGICGSYIVEENMQFFNRWIFISPEGESWSYNKRHLFSPGGENNLFTRGKDRIVFNFRDLRICPGICYDLRFPVWSRNRNDYDLLINSANWPESRREVWITLLKARAIENLCYVAGVNRIGTDGTGIRYCGDSMIADPRGEIIASADKNAEMILYSEISADELNRFREKFPVWRDADKFSIE